MLTGSGLVILASGCPIVQNITNGILSVLNQGAKLEVTCDTGYVINGPNFVYCNEFMEWNEELKGCKEQDQIYLSCDFESTDERFCGWTNDISNTVDWSADKITFMIFINSRHHVTPGSSQYFTGNYISLDAASYGGSSTVGRLISPPIPPPVQNVQRCLVFGYKVMSGSSYSITPTLKVTFGGVPHWITFEGEGKAIIGLYKFNVTANIIIEGKRCKAAIDNIAIVEGNACAQQPYEEEVDTCHDNCGKIRNGLGCSCDWECYNNKNCCPDIKLKCPFIKPLEEIAILYLNTTTTPAPIRFTTTTTPAPIRFTTTTTPAPIRLTATTTSAPIHLPTTTTSAPIHLPTTTTPTPIQLTTTTTTTPTPIQLTTTTTPAPIQLATTVKNNISIITDFNKTISSKIINESNVFNSSITVTTRMNEYITTNKITTTTNTAPLSDIPITNITQPTTFLPILTTNSTRKPFTITVTIPSMTISTKLPKIIHIFNPNSTLSIYNGTTKSLILNDSLTTINKTVGISITTTKLINTSNSTIKPPIIDFKTSSTKLIITSNVTTKLVIENTTSTINLINSSIPKITLPIKSNDSNIFREFIPKSPNTQIIKQNTVINENKSTNYSLTSAPKNADYLNITTVSNKKLEIFNTDNQNPDLIALKYNTTLKNNKSSPNNISISNVTTKYTNQTKFTFWKIVKSTTVESPHEKPKMNYSFYHKQNQIADQWLADHVNQNANPEPADSFNTVTIIKYIATIGVIMITFKYTLSFIKWYFKKPYNDEMSSCFVETNEMDTCDIELTSPSNVE